MNGAFQEISTRWLYVLIFLLMFLPSVSLAALAVYALSHRKLRGALPFAGLMIATLAIALGAGLETMGIPPALLWQRLRYLGEAAAPLASLAIATQFVGATWLTRRRLAILAGVPLLTTLFVWTNDGSLAFLRSLMWAGDHAGPWLAVHRTYSVVLIEVAVLLLAASMRQVPGRFRGQLGILLAGIQLPVLAAVVYGVPATSGSLGPLPAFLFGAGLLMAGALFFYQVFDLVPVARSVIVESMADGVVVLDARERIVDLNPAARQILGPALGEAQPLGRPAEQVFARWPGMLRLCREQAAGDSEVVLETGKERRSYELSWSPLASPEGRSLGRLIILRDVTERKRVQNSLLRQQGAVVMLEERERLAREFHDGLAQNLVALRMKIGLWDDAGGPKMRAELESLKALVSANIREVRRAIFSLRPLALDEMGFCPALRQFAGDFASLNQIHVDLRIEGPEDRLPPVLEPVLFRILQETMSNIAKHASARSVWISLIFVDPGRAVLDVQDDGVGFDPAILAAAVRGGHLGLTQMRERVEALQGDMVLSSQPGHGTQIRITLPLEVGRVETWQSAS